MLAFVDGVHRVEIPPNEKIGIYEVTSMPTIYDHW